MERQSQHRQEVPHGGQGLDCEVIRGCRGRRVGGGESPVVRSGGRAGFRDPGSNCNLGIIVDVLISHGWIRCRPLSPGRGIIDSRAY